MSESGCSISTADSLQEDAWGMKGIRELKRELRETCARITTTSATRIMKYLLPSINNLIYTQTCGLFPPNFENDYLELHYH